MNEYIQEGMLRFRFSEDIIKTRKKNMVVIAIMMPLIMIGTLFILFEGKKVEYMGLLVGIIAFASLLVGLELFIVSKILFKKLRSTTFELRGQLLVRKGGKSQETISMNELKSVVVKSDPKGNIVTINVKANHQVMNISGFEQMEVIAAYIEERINTKEIIKKKKMKVDWSNPLVNIGVMCVTFLVLMVVLKTNLNIYQYINQFVMIAFGGFFLIYKPMSRNSGKRFILFERIMGILLIVLGILNLLLNWL